MSSTTIGNWHAALANNLPDEMDTLRAEVIELDRRKADKLALLADYEELLAIAMRRAPATTKTVQPFMAEDAVAA